MICHVFFGFVSLLFYFVPLYLLLSFLTYYLSFFKILSLSATGSSSMFVDLSWCPLIVLCISCYLLIFLDISLHFLSFVDICCYLLMLVDIWWYLLMLIANCWCFLIFVDICWCLLIFDERCWYFVIFSIQFVTKSFNSSLNDSILY